MDRERRRGQDRRSDQDQQQARPAGQDRRQGADRRAALDRVRDDAKIRQLEGQWRTLEQNHPKWCHAFKRHVDITDKQLERRADNGELPDGSHGRIPANATRWQSAGAMVTAADGLARSAEFLDKRAAVEASGEPRFTVTRPLPAVLGPSWRADVYGRTAASHGQQATQWNAGSVAVGHWQRQSDGEWHPVSCYPQPGP
jgi:hypothetical protein